MRDNGINIFLDKISKGLLLRKTSLKPGVTAFSENIRSYELKKIPKLKERVSGPMMLYRSKYTLPYWRRQATANIGYMQTNLVAKSLKRKPIRPVSITTGTDDEYTGDAGVRYEANIALIAILRAGLILAKGTDKRLTELGITPYLGFVTAKREETDDATKDDFKMNIVDTGYVRLPSENEIRGMHLIIDDPMLATGSTLIYTIEKLKNDAQMDFLKDLQSNQFLLHKEDFKGL